MPSIDVVSARVAAAPKPVLCLDTCDILDVIQCLDWEKAGVPRAVHCIEPVRRLLRTLDANPDRVLVVVTDLVFREWNQNLPAVREKANKFLADIDGLAAGVARAAGLVGAVVPTYQPVAGCVLVDELEALSTALVHCAERLDLERMLIDRAIQRVMTKTRPSHEGHVKDSINFEHYLALARHLRAAAVVDECVFVSKNRRDFWDGANPRIHPDLAAEIGDPAVRLRFFGTIEAALGALRI